MGLAARDAVPCEEALVDHPKCFSSLGLSEPVSRQDLLHHLAMHIGEPEIPAAEAVGELLVVHA